MSALVAYARREHRLTPGGVRLGASVHHPQAARRIMKQLFLHHAANPGARPAFLVAPEAGGRAATGIADTRMAGDCCMIFLPQPWEANCGGTLWDAGIEKI